MSLKDDVKQAREKKMQLPYKKSSFRIIGDFNSKDYKAIVLYTHERRESRTYEEVSSDLKKVFEFVVKQPKEIPVIEEQDNDNSN